MNDTTSGHARPGPPCRSRRRQVRASRAWTSVLRRAAVVLAAVLVVPAVEAGEAVALPAPAVALPAPAVVAAGPVAAGPAVTVGGYAALGDSFSAGVGTSAGEGAPAVGTGTGVDDDGAPCRRTALAYPVLWAGGHPGTRLSFLACSGARISTVRSRQLPQVPRDSTLITVTMGGNDVGFAAVVGVCAFASKDRACTLAMAVARVVAMTDVPVQLALTLTAIKAWAPRARLVVLGYPRLFELGPCPGTAPDVARRRALNDGTDLLDGVLARTSGLFGATFVDVRGRFAGHGLCAPDGQSWINGPGDRNAYHPTAAGQARGYLPALDPLVRPHPGAGR
ncbi:MAG TPA: SGNH/GDSL hydrolase family protein [Kineosporiaceae bacterium]